MELEPLQKLASVMAKPAVEQAPALEFNPKPVFPTAAPIDRSLNDSMTGFLDTMNDFMDSMLNRKESTTGDVATVREVSSESDILEQHRIMMEQHGNMFERQRDSMRQHKDMMRRMMEENDKANTTTYTKTVKTVTSGGVTTVTTTTDDGTTTTTTETTEHSRQP